MRIWNWAVSAIGIPSKISWMLKSDPIKRNWSESKRNLITPEWSQQLLFLAVQKNEEEKRTTLWIINSHNYNNDAFSNWRTAYDVQTKHIGRCCAGRQNFLFFCSLLKYFVNVNNELNATLYIPSHFANQAKTIFSSILSCCEIEYFDACILHSSI